MKMSALNVFTVQVTHCEHTTHFSYTLQGQSLKSFRIVTCNRPNKHKALFKRRSSQLETRLGVGAEITLCVRKASLTCRSKNLLYLR